MTAFVNELLHILKSEIRLFRDFVYTLELEAQILSKHTDDDSLAKNTARKTHEAKQLAALARRRMEALTAMGYTPDLDGLDAAALEHTALIPLQSELSQLAAQAFDLHTANGIMLDVLLKHNRQALNELQSLAGYGELYDGTGRNTPRPLRVHTRIRAG